MIRKIKKALPIFTKAIGKQNLKESVSLRLFAFVAMQPVDEGLLLYNALTRQVVLLKGLSVFSIDSLDADTRQELAEDWYLVPRDTDDMKYCGQVRKLLLTLSEHGQNDTITGYTIFTTTDCNARCYYCFERGVRRFNMPEKVAKDTAAYILAHAKGLKVNLHWFGGEPLYNIPAIDTIVNILSDNGQEYKSSMVTNGYLFDRDVISRAKERWKLGHVQITLDGTKDIYNRSKAYIYKDENAYERVLNNIKWLLEAGVDVYVRLNVSSKNGNDLLALVDELHRRYGKAEGLYVYSHVLYEKTENHNKGYDAMVRERMEQGRQRLQRRITEYGYDNFGKVPHEVRTYRCMADNPHSVTVLPGGRLGKCESFSDDYFIGSIYKQGFDKAMEARFRERIELLPECASCPSYPDCNQLKMCIYGNRCDQYVRAEKLQRLHAQMINTYNAWKEWKKKK